MHPTPQQHGYTLVELLVVIAIIGLIASIAAPAASTTIDGARFRSDAHLVMAGLRKCRSVALQGQHPVIIGTKADLVDLIGPAAQSLSGDTQLNVDTPVSCFPDGTTTGGRVVLRRGERTKTITVAWLTGVMVQE